MGERVKTTQNDNFVVGRVEGDDMRLDFLERQVVSLTGRMHHIEEEIKSLRGERFKKEG